MVRDPRMADGCAAILAGLPKMGPRRFTAAVKTWGFVGALDEVLAGTAHRHREMAAVMGPDPSAVAQAWKRAAEGLDPRAVFERHVAAGVEIVRLGTDRYPSVLAADVEPPMALFVQGGVERLPSPRVAVIGTRRATSGGRQTAAAIGEELARAGVGVLSGLALGIDGAAHQGALRASATDEGAAPPVGVVATGLDIVYPRRHQQLWNAVGERGLLISEWPLGTPAAKWRFPARNRLIAALSDIVVIVESHTSGGALLTVDEAIGRDRMVMVVPGSVRSPASAGTNSLLMDGLAPMCDAGDVLRALDLSACTRATPDSPTGQLALLEPGDEELLGHIGWDPIALDVLADRSTLRLGELSVRLTRLEASGVLARKGGTIERIQ